MQLRSRSLQTLALASLLFGLTAPQVARADETKFILTDTFLLSDPLADPHAGSAEQLKARFFAAFAAGFPNRIIHLNVDRMLGSEERAVIVIPRLTAIRLGIDEISPGLREYIPIVSGEIRILDPWSNAVIYSAVQNGFGAIRIGESAGARSEDDLRSYFAKAFENWMSACFDQLRNRLSVFELRSVTLTLPPATTKLPGGAWPFGSDRDVRVGQVLTGTQPARVTAVFPHYASIEDSTSPSHPVAAGLPYVLAVVQNASGRREPRVSVEWIGGPPSSPPGVAATALSSEALLSIFAGALAAAAPVRVLLPDPASPGERETLTKTSAEISRFSLLAKGPLMDLHRDSMLQLAKEDPDYRISLFGLGSYIGSKEDGDQTLIANRIALGAAVFRRVEAAQPFYALERVLVENELGGSYALGKKRTSDPSSVWLVVSSHRATDLAKRTAAAGLLGEPGDTSRFIQASINSSTSPDWPSGAAPGAHTPLQWSRPFGTVALGTPPTPEPYFHTLQPEGGFLTFSELARQKIKPGDQLRYAASTIGAFPVVLRMGIGTDSNSFPWAQEILAALVASAIGQELGRPVRLEFGKSNTVDAQGPTLRFLLSNYTATPAPAGCTYTAQLRIALLDPNGGKSLAAAALEWSESPKHSAFNPVDEQANQLTFTHDAIDALCRKMHAANFRAAVDGAAH